MCNVFARLIEQFLFYNILSYINLQSMTAKRLKPDQIETNVFELNPNSF